MNVEILSPAGSFEHLRAAVYGGADGVYLGTKEFSARQSALNFTLAELEEAVIFCHGRGVRVYVAVNTLVKTSELEGIASLAREFGRINVDGVIVQDLAVAKIFKEVCPSLPLHGSTQMAIHNLSGALALKNMGFSRVVLARELTFSEIKEITEKCGIETEVFVHGAHCMSASGICYMSSFIGGRSGNRGRCAQPCRLDFKAGKNSFCLSLKDMCYVNYVDALKEAGVSSLKIEGRMKRPEYAYIASKTYKKALLGENFTDELRMLKGIFSRSGFTDGYISGKRDGNMFGYRKKEDVEAASRAIKEIGKIEESFKIPVTANVEIKKNEKIKLTFSSKGKIVSVYSDAIVNEKTYLPSNDRIESALKKTGGTPFFVESVCINSDFESFDSESAFPVSSLNKMRREGLDSLFLALAERKKREINEYSVPSFEKRKTKKIRPEIRIRVEKASQIGDFFGKVIIPYSEASDIPPSVDKESVILEIPFLVYPMDEEKMKAELLALKGKGFTKVICENISFVSALKEMGFSVFGGGYMNIVNPMSLLEYEKMGVSDITLSPEINLGDLSSFQSRSNIGIISYGYLPVMQFRNCPLKASVGCDKCGGNGYITDRLKKEFHLLCHNKKYVSLLNTVPVSLSGREIFVDFQTLYFTNETPNQVKNIINQFIKGKEPDYPHTKGLYFRKVL